MLFDESCKGLRCNNRLVGSLQEPCLYQTVALLYTDLKSLLILQIHWPSYLNKNLAANIAELKRQQSLGRIRHIGVSNHGCKNLKDVLDHGLAPVTNQVLVLQTF